MSFPDAIRSVLSKYATFTGRARRSEFWWFALFSVLLNIVVVVIDAVIGNSVLGYIVTLALIIPWLAVTVRRLHDTGRSGWGVLIALIPIIGAIVLLVFECQDSQPGPNSHGPSPKETGAAPNVGYPVTS